MCLIKIDVNIDQALEIITGLGDQELAIRSIDSGVSVVDSVVLSFLARRSLEINTLLGDHLEGSEGERAGLDGVCGSHNIGVGIGDVGVRVGILEGCGVRVKRPAGDVDLLAFADGV